MIEKQLAQAIEPVIDKVVELGKRVEEIAEQKAVPGPVGEKGEKGEPGNDGRDGKDAEQVEVCMDDLVEAVKSDEEFRNEIKGEKGDKGDQGLPGKDAEPVNVVALVDTITAKVSENIHVPEDGIDGNDGKPGIDGLGIETKQWAPESVFRAGEYCTAGIGKFYKAVRDTFK
jgi:hypothetical protein